MEKILDKAQVMLRGRNDRHFILMHTDISCNLMRRRKKTFIIVLFHHSVILIVIIRNTSSNKKGCFKIQQVISSQQPAK